MNATEFHRTLTVVDTHQDSIQRLVDLHHDLTREESLGYFDIPKMKRGHLSLIFMACCVDYRYIVSGEARARQNQLLHAVRDFCQQNASDLFLVERASQLDGLSTSSRAGIVMTVEGAQAIGSDLSYIDELHRLGVRAIGLTHFTSNEWADSSTDARLHGGLSGLGREAIEELNRKKIMIDLSHCSDEAFWQTLELSEAPPFASHSCSRHFVDISRNMSDDMMVALAKRGGVIGLNFVPEYIHPPYIEALSRYAEEKLPKVEGGPDLPPGVKLMRSRAAEPLGRYNAMVDAGLPAPDLDVVVQHIAHAVALVGAEHVCIGSDHGAVRFDVAGLEDCSKLPNLTERLFASGYAEADIRLIMGGSTVNYMKSIMP